MKGFLACLIKDIKLFFSRKGALLVLILPFLLLSALLPGFAQTASARSFVRPFRFALYDREDSVLSRSLISQLRSFQLFEEILVLRGEEPDRELLFEQGYAALVTLPENFFYAMYDMQNRPALMEPSPQMPGEAALLENLFSAITDIVAAEQQARLAEYRLLEERGMAPDPSMFFYESANAELNRVLARSSVFSQILGSDEGSNGPARSAFLTVAALLCMLLPFCMLRGLSEELSLGIISRLRCAGRGEDMLLASRYLAAFILLALPLILLKALFSVAVPLSGWAAVLFLFTDAFLLSALAGLSSPDPTRVQLAGNMLVLLSLLMGGALYPLALLPAFARAAAPLTLPYHFLRGMEGSWAGPAVLAVLSPVLLLLLHLLSRRKRGERVSAVPAAPVTGQDLLKTPPASRKRPDLFTMVRFRLLAMNGSRLLALLILAACLCAFLTLRLTLSGTASRQILLAVVDEDRTETSGLYLQTLSREPGISLAESDETAALRSLRQGTVEAVLFIDPGFEEAFAAEQTLPLRYQEAALSSAGTAGREICGAAALKLQSRQEALARLENAGVLQPEDPTPFDNALQEAASTAMPILQVLRPEGKDQQEVPVFGRTYARYGGFSALLIFLLVLSLSVQISSPASSAVRRTAGVLPGGKAAGLITDYAALFLPGVFLGLLALLCKGSARPGQIIAVFAYAACLSSLCQLLSLTRAAGGADMGAAFLALFTGTLGGCFFNLTAYGPVFRNLAWFTPQGLFIKAGDGSLAALLTMFLSAFLLSAVHFHISYTQQFR